MTPEHFRRDPYLRTAGYHLMLWGPLNILFSLPGYDLAFGKVWRGSSVFTLGAIVVFLGIKLMGMAERRATKLMGPADEETAWNPTRMWAILIVTAVFVTCGLEMTGFSWFIMPTWMIAVGVGNTVWGAKTVAPLAYLGVFVFTTGTTWVGMLLGMPNMDPGVLGLHLWNATMGIGFLITALVINRRYVWNFEGASAAAGAPVEPA